MYPVLLFEQSEDIQMQAFYNTPLGILYKAIPFEALSKQIPKPKRALSGKGCKSWFDVKGGIALQILKSYYRISDALLIEQLNGNWQMQFFCGMQLKQGEQIKDKDIVGRWRSYLARHIDIDEMQLSCAERWKPYMQHVHTGFTDATVFESYIEYPTDAKLLWNSCTQVYCMIKQTRKNARLRDTRINHDKHKSRWLHFAKSKKKTKRQNKKICKQLLRYLERLIKQLDQLQQKHVLTLGAVHYNRLVTINTIKEQQWRHYFGKEAKVPDRIVSLHKPYVRPIVRGKEVKPVEFGAKVNMLLVDGISFMEHFNFDNFNEGTRLQSTIHLQRKYFGACYQIGADAIYATNKNRKYCTKNEIATSFVAKGNEGKNKDQKSQMRSIPGKVRSTVLEGSFGNEKNHYQMNKIKAKTKDNEKAWIFFSLLTCNAMQIAKRMQAAEKEKLKQLQQQAA
ncbi:MAG TPA: transposase [Parafilimonas sp.]|nr:transposase [Parafilimonas sp.]